MIRTACLALALSAAPAAADILDPALYTTYAPEKGACGQGRDIEMRDDRITGPGFACTVLDSLPAGTGLVAHTADCTVDGTATTDILVLDLGNNPDRFVISLPGSDAWISMYPCTPVEGLDPPQ